jgi:hypothetical protein
VGNGGDVLFTFDDEDETGDDHAVQPLENNVSLKSILLEAVSVVSYTARELDMLQVCCKMEVQ